MQTTTICMGSGHIREWGLTWGEDFGAGGPRSARRAAPRTMVTAWTGDGSDACDGGLLTTHTWMMWLGSNGRRDSFLLGINCYMISSTGCLFVGVLRGTFFFYMYRLLSSLGGLIPLSHFCTSLLHLSNATSKTILALLLCNSSDKNKA